jgi:hypothetical protein
VDDGVEAGELRRLDVADVGSKGGEWGCVTGEIAALVEECVQSGHVVSRLAQDTGEDRADVAVVSGDENVHRA